MGTKTKWTLVTMLAVVVLGVGAFLASQTPQDTSHYSVYPAFRTFQELVDETEAVVEVTVLSKKAVLDEREKAVYTLSDVRVVKTLVGPLEPGTVFTTRMRGGKVGEVSTPFSGEPLFEPGTQHLMFVEYDVFEERPDLNGWHLVAGFQSRAEIIDGKLYPFETALANPMKRWKGKTVSDVEKALQQAKAQTK